MHIKRLSLILMSVLIILLTACDNATLAPSNAAQFTITVRDDLPLLRTRINLPATVIGAKWVVLPLGTTNGQAPGPTDTILYAYLIASDDQPLSFGATPRQDTTQQSVTLPSDVAEAIIPSNESTGIVKKPGSYQMQGTPYDPSYFDLGSYRGLFAIKLNNGMLVALQTR